LEIIVYSFDGDSVYNTYLVDFDQCFRYINKLDLNEALYKAFSDHFDTLIFYDLFHLVKCDRYRRSKNVIASLHIFDEGGEVSPESFTELGIPDKQLNDSPARKRGDQLTLQFFSICNLIKAAKSGNVAIFILLIPSTLLLDSIFNPELTRNERLERISLSFSVILIYYHLQFSKISHT
jgi:hypothetical protein